MPIIEKNPAWANILSGLVAGYGVEQGMKRRKQEDERQKQIDAQNAAATQAGINYETAETDYEKARTNQINSPPPNIPQPKGKNGKPPSMDDMINYYVAMAAASKNPDEAAKYSNIAGVLSSRVQYPQQNIAERNRRDTTRHSEFLQTLSERKREAVQRIGEQRYEANLRAARRSMYGHSAGKGRGGSMSMQDREDMAALSAYYRSIGQDATEADRNAEQEFQAQMEEWRAGFSAADKAGTGQDYIQQNPMPSPTINVNSPQQQPQILMIKLPDGRTMPVVTPNRPKPQAQPKASPSSGGGGDFTGWGDVTPQKGAKGKSGGPQPGDKYQAKNAQGQTIYSADGKTWHQ